MRNRNERLEWKRLQFSRAEMFRVLNSHAVPSVPPWSVTIFDHVYWSCHLFYGKSAVQRIPYCYAYAFIAFLFRVYLSFVSIRHSESISVAILRDFYGIFPRYSGTYLVILQGNTPIKLGWIKSYFDILWKKKCSFRQSDRKGCIGRVIANIFGSGIFSFYDDLVFCKLRQGTTRKFERIYLWLDQLFKPSLETWEGDHTNMDIVREKIIQMSRPWAEYDGLWIDWILSQGIQ